MKMRCHVVQMRSDLLTNVAWRISLVPRGTASFAVHINNVFDYKQKSFLLKG